MFFASTLNLVIFIVIPAQIYFRLRWISLSISVFSHYFLNNLPSLLKNVISNFRFQFWKVCSLLENTQGYLLHDYPAYLLHASVYLFLSLSLSNSVWVCVCKTVVEREHNSESKSKHMLYQDILHIQINSPS